MTADPVGLDKKSCLHTMLEYCVLARSFLPIPTGSALCTVFGAISSSSILGPILYTAHYSMENTIQYLEHNWSESVYMVLLHFDTTVHTEKYHVQHLRTQSL